MLCFDEPPLEATGLAHMSILQWLVILVTAIVRSWHQPAVAGQMTSFLESMQTDHFGHGRVTRYPIDSPDAAPTFTLLTLRRTWTRSSRVTWAIGRRT